MAGASEGVHQPLIGSHEPGGILRGAFTSSAAALLVVLLALFAILVGFDYGAASEAQIAQYYWW